jgi:hypothetical protein
MRRAFWRMTEPEDLATCLMTTILPLFFSLHSKAHPKEPEPMLRMTCKTTDECKTKKTLARTNLKLVHSKMDI